MRHDMDDFQEDRVDFDVPENNKFVEEISQNLLDKKVIHMDLLENDTCYEQIMGDGTIFRLWAPLQNDKYGELDYQIIKPKEKIR